MSADRVVQCGAYSCCRSKSSKDQSMKVRKAMSFLMVPWINLLTPVTFFGTRLSAWAISLHADVQEEANDFSAPKYIPDL